MKRKLIFFGVVFLILASLRVYDVYIEGRDGRDSADFVSLVTLPFESIDRIRLLAPSGSLDISRSKSIATQSPLVHRANWVLKDPFLAPASDDVVAELVEKVRSFKAEPFILSEEDMEGAPEIDEVSGSSDEEKVHRNPYGLTPPELVLIIDTTDEKKVISFGSKNEISGRRFVQVEGDPKLYLMEEDFPKYFASIKNRIKSREVIKIDPAKVRSVDVVEGDNFFRLVSGGCEKPDQWNIDASREVWLADRELVERKIGDLSRLVVSRIFDDAVAIFPYTGLETPFLILNLSVDLDEGASGGCGSGNKIDLLLQFGKGVGINKTGEGSIEPAQSYFLKIGDDPRIYGIERTFISDWLQGPGHFRVRTPFQGLESAAHYQGLEISDPGLRCSAIISKSGISEGPEGEFHESIKSLSDFLSQVRLDAVISEPELSLYNEKEGARISILLESGKVSLKEMASIEIAEGGNMELAPLVVEIVRINEPTYYGVINGEQVTQMEKIIKGFCGKDAHSS